MPPSVRPRRSSSWEPPDATSTTSMSSFATIPHSRSSPSRPRKSRALPAGAIRRRLAGARYPDGISIHDEADARRHLPCSQSRAPPLQPQPIEAQAELSLALRELRANRLIRLRAVSHSPCSRPSWTGARWTEFLDVLRHDRSVRVEADLRRVLGRGARPHCNIRLQLADAPAELAVGGMTACPPTLRLRMRAGWRHQLRRATPCRP